MPYGSTYTGGSARPSLEDMQRQPAPTGMLEFLNNPELLARLKAAQEPLHAIDTGTPIGELDKRTLDAEVRNPYGSSDSDRKQDYYNPAMHKLLMQRHGLDRIKSIQDVPKGNGDRHPYAFAGTGRAYVDANNTEKYPHNWQRLANHELEHAYNQNRWKHPYASNAADYNNPANKQEINKWRDTANRKHAVAEVAPGISDLIFSGEHRKQVLGPLFGELGRQVPAHEVNLPSKSSPFKSHEIGWMTDKAKEHGYWDGRPMEDMMFNTPEGRQWTKQMIGYENPNTEKYEPPKGRYTTNDPPGLMRLLNSYY